MCVVRFVIPETRRLLSTTDVVSRAKNIENGIYHLSEKMESRLDSSKLAKFPLLDLLYCNRLRSFGGEIYIIAAFCRAEI